MDLTIAQRNSTAIVVPVWMYRKRTGGLNKCIAQESFMSSVNGIKIFHLINK